MPIPTETIYNANTRKCVKLVPAEVPTMFSAASLALGSLAFSLWVNFTSIASQQPVPLLTKMGRHAVRQGYLQRLK